MKSNTKSTESIQQIKFKKYFEPKNAIAEPKNTLKDLKNDLLKKEFQRIKELGKNIIFIILIHNR